MILTEESEAWTTQPTNDSVVTMVIAPYDIQGTLYMTLTCVIIKALTMVCVYVCGYVCVLNTAYTVDHCRVDVYVYHKDLT